MGRLIDADALYEKLQNDSSYDLDFFDAELRQIIEGTPTAYDVEKVVAELRKSEICPNCLNNINPVSVCATFCDVGKKLEMVRNGGVWNDTSVED